MRSVSAQYRSVTRRSSDSTGPFFPFLQNNFNLISRQQIKNNCIICTVILNCAHFEAQRDLNLLSTINDFHISMSSVAFARLVLLCFNLFNKVKLEDEI